MANSPVPRVLFCQRCGLSQVIPPYRAPAPCDACESAVFHAVHPQQRMENWQHPGPSRYDKALLRELGAAWREES